MNDDVTKYILNTKPWQANICTKFREMIHATVPTIEERLQYGKPHYLKDGSYTAVLYASKDKVSFMLFNAKDVPEIAGLTRSLGDGDRKVFEILEGQAPDYAQIAEYTKQTTATL
jgi:hypothetical protein